ncbi:MAG: ATP-dependent DNA helicase UvrD2, partial [Actinomycetota bacterium]
NYRSSPEVLVVANRLAGSLGGFEKVLRATREPGPDPLIHSVADERGEIGFVLHAVRRLHASGTPLEEMAILVRINARTEPYEEAFAEAGIPYQVRDGAFLRRPGPRAAIARLRRGAGDVAPAVAAATEALGYDPDAEPDSAEEVTRQADLGRLRALAVEFAAANPGGDLEAFLVELRGRFSTETEGRGVQLLTYHRAKGLEFDAVFLPRLLDGEIPFRSGRSRAPVEEELRLLYVGVTRARTHLAMTWPLGTKAGRTPFLDGLVRESAVERTRAPRERVEPVPGAGGTFEALKRWRLERSKADGVPAYVVFHDATLATIAERRPGSHAELRSVPGIGPAKLERYGDEVLAVVAAGASPG